MAEGTRIKVAVRCRPFNKREIGLGGPCIVTMAKTDNGEQTMVNHGEAEGANAHKFTYDHSFWSYNKGDPHFATQSTVYNAIGKPIVDNALDGFNNTVFAYGQTGSGKTYSMMGNPDDKGITPRLCDDLFERIDKLRAPNLEITVECSYFEIYSEKVFDLLNPAKSGKNAKALKVRESPVLGPYVQGLKPFAVSSFVEVDHLLEQGQRSRHVAGTAMNATSSRSHAIFALTVTQAFVSDDGTKDDDMEKSSKINLVDLAGSERQAKTMATGARLSEGSAINLSLSSLGMVINALVKASGEGGKAKSHIPYRDSLLTWILKESFGGNAKTVMVAAISPALDNYEETMSTLRYADNAKHIVNKAVVNEGASAKIIRELKEQIEALKSGQQGAAMGGDEEGSSPETSAAELAEAQALLERQTMSFEERLAASKAEMELVIKGFENDKKAAEYRAQTLKKGSSLLKGRMAGMRWRANAHITAIERKLEEGVIPRREGSTDSADVVRSGDEDSAELEARVDAERKRAQELQDHLDELLQLSKLDVQAMTEYHNNVVEIELLKKFVTNCNNGAKDQSVLLAEIQVIEEKTAAVKNMEPQLLEMLSNTASRAGSMSDAGNVFNPFSHDMNLVPGESVEDVPVDTTGATPAMVAKMRAMEEQLRVAKSSGDAAPGDAGGEAAAFVQRPPRTSHGRAIFNDLLNRRRAIFAVSRGLKPKGQVCLRTYVIMTCPSAPQVLAEGSSSVMHGAVRLNNVACAGHLSKKGKNRHNWKSRWFLFDLRHRRIVYFDDQTLKKENGYFDMDQVMHVLKAPMTSTKVEEIEKEKRKFLVITPKRTWHLMAPTEESRDMWVSVFLSVVGEDASVSALHSDIAVSHGGGLE